MFARTDRLLLRPGWSEDAPALYDAIRDPDIVRNLASAPWPYRPSDAEAFLARGFEPDEARCLIFLRTRGAPKLIGVIGLDRTRHGTHELGYWIGRPFWGLGFATEAGRAMVDFARGLRFGRLEAGHFLDNPASGRVLRKLGFTPTGTVAQRYSAGRGAEAPCRLFELKLNCDAEAETETCEETCAMAA